MKKLIEKDTSRYYNKSRRGALAQLGERKVRNLEARGSIPLRSTMMTYPDDCRAYKAKAESMEGHIRRMPATGKPSGADRADAFEPFETRLDSSGSFFMLYFLTDIQIAVC